MFSTVGIDSRPCALFLALLCLICAPLVSRAEPDAGNAITPQAFFNALNLDYPGLGGVKKAVAAGDLTAAAAAYLQFRRTGSQAHYSIDPAEKPATATESTDEEGDLLLKHIVVDRWYHLVQDPMTFGSEIDWTFNPRQPSDPNYTTEVQWAVFNRHEEWNTLAKAYWATLDEKYTREWIAELKSWRNQCPANVTLDIGAAESSMAWRPIEAGLRMSHSWPTAYFHFLNAADFTPEANLLYATSVLEHCLFLTHITLDYPTRTGNHIDMECNGLATAACLFPEFKDADRFVSAASDRLTKEIVKQVYPDGAEFELTPGYHQVALQNFDELAKILALNGRTVPKAYDEKLHDMNRFFVALMDPMGRIPVFNDSWYGMKARSLLKEPLKRWDDPFFKFAMTGGKEGTAPPLSVALPYAGFYTMRSDWSPDGVYACFRGGPAGEGHWHEDKLQFVVTAFGQSLLLDPGRYPYDKSEWRRYCLSTPAHNTLTVDGKEQHRGGLEKITDPPQPTGNPWMTTPSFDYVSATYDSGYQETKYVARQYLPVDFVGEADKSVSHTRYFFFLKPGYFLAVDLLEGAGTHRYDAYFHLDAPDAAVDPQSKIVKTLRTDEAQLALIPLDLEGLNVRKAIGQESPVLGWTFADEKAKRAIPTIVYTKEAAAPATFATIAYPYRQDAPTVSAYPLETEPALDWSRCIETPLDQVDLAINRKGTSARLKSPLLGPFSTDATVVLVRRVKADQSLSVGFSHGTSLAWGDAVALSLDAPADLLVNLNPAKEAGSRPTVAGFVNPSDKPVTVHLTKPTASTVTVPPAGSPPPS